MFCGYFSALPTFLSLGTLPVNSVRLVKSEGGNNYLWIHQPIVPPAHCVYRCPGLKRLGMGYTYPEGMGAVRDLLLRRRYYVQLRSEAYRPIQLGLDDKPLIRVAGSCRLLCIYWK